MTKRIKETSSIINHNIMNDDKRRVYKITRREAITLHRRLYLDVFRLQDVLRSA